MLRRLCWTSSLTSSKLSGPASDQNILIGGGAFFITVIYTEHMKKAVIFDFDGTLADTMQQAINIFNRLSPEYGYSPLEDSQIETLRTKGARELLSMLQMSKLKIPGWMLRVKKEMAQEIPNVKPFNGIKDAVKAIKDKGLVLGILTSNTVENVELFLKNNDMELFDFVDSENNLFGKDKALLKLLNRQKFDPQDIWYVGDEIRDIEACKKVGVDIIAVTWGYNSESALQELNPEKLISSPVELPLLFS